MSSAAYTLSEDDEQRTRDLLVGRRIVKAERGEWKQDRWYYPATGKLTLDDGTVIYVRPNIGGCSCGAGDYELEHLATVENAITDVRLVTEQNGSYEESKSYRIYVIADAVEINAVQIDGDDGNGYYGTGYTLFVVPPEVAA